MENFGFKIVDVKNLNENTFKLIDDDWMLITAGDIDNCNMMTASWGGFGILWNKQVVFVFVRPVRHTYKFMETYDKFTLSFFDESRRSILSYCGKYSGRDVNKASETGITAFELKSNGIGFKEARMILECKKIYYSDIDPKHFMDSKIENNYPNKDFHRMYVGEILNCYKIL